MLLLLHQFAIRIIIFNVFLFGEYKSCCPNSITILRKMDFEDFHNVVASETDFIFSKFGLYHAKVLNF